MSFKSFAIAGAGNIGFYISEELLKQKQAGKATDVVVLTRSLSKNENIEKLATQGAKIVAVDYASEESLIGALKGIDVAISTIASSSLESQVTFFTAAKKAGVRLAVPSEFGIPTDKVKEGPLKVKQQLHLKLKEIDIPYLLVFTGPFADFAFQPLAGVDLQNGKATVIGDGNTPISFTSRRDIGRYLAYVLTTLPVEQLKDKIIRIEGERISFNEALKEYTAKTGKKIDITYKPIAELEAAYVANPQDIFSWLFANWAKGGAQVGKPEELSNGLYPDWNPQKVIEVIAL